MTWQRVVLQHIMKKTNHIANPSCIEGNIVNGNKIRNKIWFAFSAYWFKGGMLTVSADDCF